MARELLKPEDATTWDDFLERIAVERCARNDHLRSVRSMRGLLFGLSLVLLSYVIGWQGQWWQWLGAIAVLAVGGLGVAAVCRAESDRERLRELDLLELGWKSHLEHPRH